MTQSPFIIFDLGNVLIRHDNEMLTQRLIAGAADKSAARKYLLEAVAADESSGDGYSTGRSTVRDFHDRYAAGFGYTRGYEAFADDWCCHFSRDEAMEELAATLAKTYRVVVLSNTNAVHWDHIMANYAVMKIPHRLYASQQLGLVKPDPVIYRHVLKAEGYAPGDAIFIDDRAENLEAANAFGIHGILFTGRAALEPALKALGVEVRCGALPA